MSRVSSSLAATPRAAAQIAADRRHLLEFICDPDLDPNDALLFRVDQLELVEYHRLGDGALSVRPNTSPYTTGTHPDVTRTDQGHSNAPIRHGHRPTGLNGAETQQHLSQWGGGESTTTHEESYL